MRRDWNVYESMGNILGYSQTGSNLRLIAQLSMFDGQADIPRSVRVSGEFSRAITELNPYLFWLRLKMLSHSIWGSLPEYFRYLLSFSAKTTFSKQPLFI